MATESVPVIPWRLRLEPSGLSDEEQWVVCYQAAALGGFRLVVPSEQAAHSIGRDIRLTLGLGLVQWEDYELLYRCEQRAVGAWMERHSEEVRHA